MNMMELLKKVYPLRMAPVSEGVDLADQILLGELPFEVLEFPSLSEHNGWIVPLKWEVKKAAIYKDGKLVYDGMQHPLCVMGYSKSFSGTLSLEELKEHLSYRADMPTAIGYHCDWFYKQHMRDWGFCIPYDIYKKLQPGNYEVELETSSEKGKMKVLDLYIPGEKRDTIILNAHNCHAGQANDDVAGMVVGTEIAKRLMKRKNRYSYRLIIAPEHLGTVFYLASKDDKLTKTFKFGIFLEMLGNDNRFALQKSLLGDTDIDRAAMNYLSHKHQGFHYDDFRNIVGNDESVWEAPGYEVPMISISRAPYKEYHTNFDNEKIISEQKLEESVNAVMGILEIIETNCVMKRKFKGLVALSNPKYDLYRHTVDPSIDRIVTKDDIKWNRLMDRLPRYFDGKKTILDIAEIHSMSYKDVYDYVVRFKEKGLVEFAELGAP
jgi:aminopeptidase-like protein